MKINRTLTALIASAGIGISGQALAAATVDDTAAGTTISNTASFSYTVGAVTTSLDSDPTDFIVDTKVDLTLEWNDATYVTADVGDVIVIKLLLSNEGNSVQSFKFISADSSANTVLPKLAAHVDYDGSDDADTNGTWSYYLDSDGSGGTDDVYTDGGEGSALPGDVISNLAIDTDDTEIVTIWAVGSNLDDTGDLSQIGVEIGARAWNGSNYLMEGNIDRSGDLDKNASLDEEFIVFADTVATDSAITGLTLPDGGYVVLTEILVAAPIISITKSVKVTSSPFTLSDGSFVAIPGSTIEYTVTVTNDGTGDASLITVTDPLDDANYLLTDTVANTAVTFLNVDGSAAATGPGASDDSNIAIDASDIYSLDLRLKGKEEATITFDVELL